MKALSLACLLWGWALAGTVLARSTELVVLEASAADAEDAARLRELLDRPVRGASLPDAPQDPVEFARSLGASEVLVLDAEHHRVLLVREDGQVLTRDTEQGHQPSPYVVPFIAAELLTLSAQLDREQAHRFRLRGLELRAALQDRWAGEPFTPMWRPSLGLGGIFARERARVRLVTVLEGSLRGQAQRATDLGEVHLVRDDLGLGVGADYRLSRFVLRAMAQADLGLTRADYDGPYGRTQHHASGSFGGVLELQTSILSWLSAYAAFGASGAFARAQYQVSGQPVAQEAAWWGRATLGLICVFSPR